MMNFRFEESETLEGKISYKLLNNHTGAVVAEYDYLPDLPMELEKYEKIHQMENLQKVIEQQQKLIDAMLGVTE